MVQTELRPQFCAEIDRRLHTDTIQHQTGAPPAGYLLDPLGGRPGVAIVDDVVGAKRLCLFQFLVIHVGGNDTHRREHTKQLYRHMSQAADAHHNHGAIGV